MEITIEKIQKVVEEEINPILQFHSGSCEIKGLDSNVLTLQLRGGCAGCPASQITLYNGIVPILQQHFPGIEIDPYF